MIQGAGLLPKLVTDWGSDIQWANNDAPTLSLVAGDCDLLQFVKIGTKWFGRVWGLNYDGE